MSNRPAFIKSREFWLSTGIFLFTVLWFGIFALVRIDLHRVLPEDGAGGAELFAPFLALASAEFVNERP